MLKLEGKKFLIFGIANNRSLAWSIAEKLKEAGAEIGMNYINEKMGKKLENFAETIDAKVFEQCDVTNPDEMDAFFKKAEEVFGKIDGVVHSVAFAERDDLDGRFIETSREGFRKAMDISAYSLVDISRRAEPLLNDGGSIVTLSFLGAHRIVPNYNVMGVAKAALESCVKYLANDFGPREIRVNAISAGAIKTLSATGIKNFRNLLPSAVERSPMNRNIDAESVGTTACFLLSPMSKFTTGDVIYVDCGVHLT